MTTYQGTPGSNPDCFKVCLKLVTSLYVMDVENRLLSQMKLLFSMQSFIITQTLTLVCLLQSMAMHITTQGEPVFN